MKKGSKYWATLTYCQDISLIDRELKNLHINVLLSPLHDSDIKEHIDIINEHTYTSYRIKKSHYHILFQFENSITETSFRYLLEHKLSFQCVGAELVLSFNGMARYLAHLDNPEKAQYDKGFILYYGILDDSVLISPKQDKIDKDYIISQLIDVIIDYRVEDMITLYRVIQHLRPDMLVYVSRYANQLEKFTRGMYQCSLRAERKKSVAVTTTKKAT